MREAIRNLGDLLIREGYVDNEPDAFLAAMRIYLAAEAQGLDVGGGSTENEPLAPIGGRPRR